MLEKSQVSPAEFEDIMRDCEEFFAMGSLDGRNEAEMVRALGDPVEWMKEWGEERRFQEISIIRSPETKPESIIKRLFGLGLPEHKVHTQWEIPVDGLKVLAINGMNAEVRVLGLDERDSIHIMLEGDVKARLPGDLNSYRPYPFPEG